VAYHDFRGYRENMEDIGVKKLLVEFSQDRDLEVIKAKILAFLKDDVAERGTVTCVIREAGRLAPPCHWYITWAWARRKRE
jgi:hypothetical protein